MSKRHCLSHAAGGASCAAWQLRPRGTHRVGLFSLDFLWFFLVSRQERTLNMLFTKISDLLFGSLADVVFLKSFFILANPLLPSKFHLYLSTCLLRGKFLHLRCKESEQFFGKVATCIAKISVPTVKPRALPWARHSRPFGA